MENYQCGYCLSRYENPIQCLRCKSVFCKKHMNSDNICPVCKCFPFNYKEKTIINSSLNQKSKYKCVVCGDKFGEDNNAFLIHIIYNHKNDMLCFFNQNDKNQNQDIVNSINNNININLNKSTNQSKEKSIINNNINKNIYYCGKKNEIIKCECCPDHICKEGNCLCVECMRINFNKLNLSQSQLINRAGKIANFFKGSFFCGKEYESITDNSITHQQYKNLKKCEYPFESCNDCQVLTKFRNIYFNYIQ